MFPVFHPEGAFNVFRCTLFNSSFLQAASSTSVQPRSLPAVGKMKKCTFASTFVSSAVRVCVCVCVCIETWIEPNPVFSGKSLQNRSTLTDFKNQY
jgi:hypothetical protein